MKTQAPEPSTKINPAQSRKRAWVLLCLTWIFLGGWLAAQTLGPIHMWDEVGYLTKAAFFSGQVVDAASSYHAGYSLLLAPVLFFTTDITLVWAYVVGLNVCLWLTMLALAGRLARILAQRTPSLRSPWGVGAAVLALALYPSWAVMTGYAFPSLLMAALQMLCVVLLWALSRGRWPYLLGFSVCVGFTYWVHPTGMVLLVASALVLPFALPRRTRWLGWGLHLLVLLLMTAVYARWLHPYVNQAMTPPGQTLYTHYDKAHPLALLDPATAALTLLRTLGQLGYLGVASLGVVWLGALAVLAAALGLRGRRAPLCWRVVRRSPLLLLGGYALLSVAGVALLSSAMFQTIVPGGGVTRIQHWHYGRYVDPLMPPLLLLGVMALAGPARASHLQPRRLWLMGLALLLLGLALQWGATTRGTNMSFLTPAFWPQYQLPELRYGAWYALGALGVVASLRLPLRWLCLPALALALLSLQQQHQVREQDLRGPHLLPSGLVGLIRASHAPGTCVGIDWPHEPRRSNWQEARWQYLALHLLDMRFQRMSFEHWLTQCPGPYLTRDPSQAQAMPDVAVVAQEPHSGIYLLEQRSTPLLQHLTGDLQAVPGWANARALGPLKPKLGGALRYPVQFGTAAESASNALLDDGWHTAEAEHVWSQGRAALWLPTPETCREAAWEAVLRFSAFAASAQRPVQVQWQHRASGERWAWTVTSSEPMEARLPLPQGLLAHEWALEVPQATSPEQLGLSTDARVLGIALHSADLLASP